MSRRLDGGSQRAGAQALPAPKRRAVNRYFADVAVLARKDLKLELRARSTVPAMLLFVVAALVVFHFALPADSSELAAKGMLWIAIVFTALLGLTRAFVAEREQRLIDGLLLAPCDRSAIWLAKSLSVLGFLVVAELVALPAYALFFSGIDGATVAGVALADLGICAVGTVLAAMAVAGRARELLLPLLFLPLAIPIVVGGVGASVTGEPGRYLGFLVLYDVVFAIISWASFEYVVTE
jgi:heme exporter protein B